MTQDPTLLDSWLALFVALSQAIGSLFVVALPWLPLAAWLAFWLFAVNWKKLYPVLWQGGLVGVLLLGFVAVLVWSSISIPAGGQHSLFGLRVDNVLGKGMYVSGLVMIAFLCGSVQLSGACGSVCNFEEPVVEEAGHGHGHDHH